MSNDQQYAGWTNYQTWAVSLWLTNEYPGIPEGSTAQDIQGSVESIVDEQDLPGLLNDLLMHSLDQVNWVEIEEDNK